MEFPDAERVRSKNKETLSAAVDGGVMAGVIVSGVLAEEPRRGLDDDREKSLGSLPKLKADVLIGW